MKKLLLILFVLSYFGSAAQVTLSTSNLPIIIVNTNGQYIPDSPKIVGTMGIINNAAGLANNVTDSFNEYNGNIGIEVRGQSSQSFPMVSYSIELLDSTGIGKRNASLFGLASEHDWILYAPYTDKTQMRNFLAYTLSNSLGHWSSHCRFVEMVLNGNYVGIYVLEEKIKRDSGRVNIKKMSVNDSAGNTLTGGYIFRIDKDPNVWYSSYFPPSAPNRYIGFSYVYPKAGDITVPQQNYLQNYVDSFEKALASPSFQDTLTGFRKYADEASFIDYFIVNEVSRNVDAYRLSSYFYKNRNSINSKIIAGPVWDYNLAYRNADYCNGDNYQSWAYKFNYVCPTDQYVMPFWWDRFMQDTLFKAHLLCRWKQQRQGVLSLAYQYHLIDSIATLLSQAQVRNFIRWPILGQYVWPNPSPIPNTYAGEISALKAWIANRLSWMDANLPKIGSCVNTLPLTLTNFNIKKINDNAVLAWQTLSETNTDHFVLQRSADAVHFTNIATVKAAGNSSGLLTYHYTDEAISKWNKSKLYYRLQMTDKDGSFTLSNTVSLTINNAAFHAQLFPNPVADHLGLFIYTSKQTTVQVKVMDEEGRIMITATEYPEAGNNQFVYNTASWAKGIYLLRVLTQNGDCWVEKVVK